MEHKQFLEVPSAMIHYKVAGSGPIMVLVAGATGEHTIFDNLAKHLMGSFTVVAYDRRGFSHSCLTGAQDYAKRLSTDVDDARRLIQHVSDEPAFVFGNSSGAIIALELMIQHPNVVRSVFAHEAPLINLHPNRVWWRDFFQKVYDVYRRSGVLLSARLFADGIASELEEAIAVAGVFDAREGPFIAANAMYWYERELRQYPCVTLDMQALKARSDKIIIAGGRESSETSCYLPVNQTLAAGLAKDIVVFPGAHGGYVTHPEDFASVMCTAAFGVGIRG